MSLDASEFQKRFRNSLGEDVNFGTLFYGDSYTDELRKPIPKNAHFVYVTTEGLNWINYLAIKGAVVNLRVEKVKIWIPEDTELEGEIWEKIGQLPGVEFYPIKMPSTVYGFKIADAAGKADVVKLKVLYEEGGIALENDLIPLRHMDMYFNTTDTRPTIMAERIAPEGLPNWLIISKAKSPFLRRWMEEYAEDRDLNSLATQTPFEFLKRRDPYLEVMSGRTWFYPLASDMDGDMSLKMLWFGKSWHDIDESFGTHVWHWKEEFRDLVTPEIVREIDTPIFCRLRPLFDGVDGKKAKPWQKDPKCAITLTSDLDTKNHGLFADYIMSKDRNPMKLIDSSGFHLHGWAPNGTATMRAGWKDIRAITEGDYAVFPVPRNFDARVFTVQMSLHIDPITFSTRTNATLLKLRLGKEDGEVTISLRSKSAQQNKNRVKELSARGFDETGPADTDAESEDVDEEADADPEADADAETEGAAEGEGLDQEAEVEEEDEETTDSTTSTSPDSDSYSSNTPPAPSSSSSSSSSSLTTSSTPRGPIPDLSLTLLWRTNSHTPASLQSEPLAYTSAPKLSALAPPSSNPTLHTLTISLDRAKAGSISLYLDGVMVSHDPVPVVGTGPKFVQEVWLNGVGWDELDGGVRGGVERMSWWAEGVPEGNLTEFMREGGVGGWGSVEGGGGGAFGGGFGFGRGRGGRFEGQGLILAWMFFGLGVLVLVRSWGRVRRVVTGGGGAGLKGWSGVENGEAGGGKGE